MKVHIIILAVVSCLEIRPSECQEVANRTSKGGEGGALSAQQSQIPVSSPASVLKNSEQSSQIIAPILSLNDILSSQTPTILQEVLDDAVPPSKATPPPNIKSSNRVRNNDRRIFRGGLFQQKLQFLRRLMGMGIGPNFLARKLSLFSGGNQGSGRASNSNPELSSAVGPVSNSSDDKTLQEHIRDFDPIQILRDTFEVKRNKLVRWRKVKDAYQRKEFGRRVSFFSDDSGDILTRKVRNIILGLLNFYEKNTDTMQVVVDYRRQKLERFLEIPIVASVLGNRTVPAEEGTVSSERQPSQDSTGESPASENYDDETFPTFNPIAAIARKIMQFVGNFAN